MKYDKDFKMLGYKRNDNCGRYEKRNTDEKLTAFVNYEIAKQWYESRIWAR